MQTSRILNSLQSDAIPTLVAWAEKHDAVRAVLLTSTRAIPDAPVDILSDYDVILVVRELHPWVDDRAWLGDFGNVLVAYWDPIHLDAYTGIEVCANVIQYTSGLKIDFTLWPVQLLRKITQSHSLPGELDAGYRILLDKDHLAEGMQPTTGKAYVLKPPTLEEYRLLINDFLSDAPYVAKCLWRDELLPAKWCLDYDMKQVYLRRVLEWKVEIDNGWSVPVGYLGKGLKKRLPPEFWANFEQCYGAAQLLENWNALDRTMELFRRVATEVGTSLGYSYPDQLHEQVAIYVSQIRHL